MVIQANININSPLVFDHTMSGALRVYAAANQSVAIPPAIFGGTMGPVTQAAIIAQTHAEIMAGIALAQLVRKGCPVVYGSFHSTMNSEIRGADIRVARGQSGHNGARPAGTPTEGADAQRRRADHGGEFRRWPGHAGFHLVGALCPANDDLGAVRRQPRSGTRPAGWKAG